MFESRVDSFAIALSFACLLHCLVLPVALVMLPSIPVAWLGDEQFHRWLLVVILPTSTIALTMGCRKHRNFRVLFTGAAGMLVLLWAGVFGHDQVGEFGEKVATTLGAIVIAFSHVMNQRLCRQSACRC